MNIVQHASGVLFATWFVHREDGKPTWYVVSDGTWKHPYEFHGVIYKTTGPYYGGPFDPKAVGVEPVGNAVFGLVGHDSRVRGAVFYLDGKTIVKQIRRMEF